MLITDVFDTMKASQAWYDKNKVKKSDGQYSYVSRSGSTNGLEGVIGKQDRDPNAGNAITIGVDTQTVFYQPMPFYTSVKIQVLRSEEHTSELQSRGHLVCRLLLEKKKKLQRTTASNRTI